MYLHPFTEYDIRYIIFLINKSSDVNELYFEYCNEFKNKRKVSKTYFLEYY